LAAGSAVPAGYARQRERDAWIVALPSVLPEIVAAVRAAGTLYDWAAARADAQPFTGRGAAYRVRVGDVAALVRHYRRGGLVARLVDDSYVRAGEPRPLRELRASAAVRAAGVPSPEVLAAVVYARGAIYRGDLATRFVPDSSDLAALTWGSARWPEPLRTAAWRAAGALLRRAFAAGVRHPDLNLRNILVTHTGDRTCALLLDLDRVRLAAVADVARHAMLERLHRSRRKLEAAAGEPVGAAELAALEAGLTGDVPA
jgi:3-deoxy-D-manno-octulosonic acid kinase